MKVFDSYGEYITYLRKDRGLKQDKLARLMNLSKQTLSKYETGVSKISLSYASEFARILGVDLTSFINRIDEKNNNCCELRSFDFNKLSSSLIICRKKRFLTQEDVAIKLNISKSRVSKIENGYIIPYLEEFKKLKDIYQVSYEKLYFNLNNKEEYLLLHNFKKDIDNRISLH